MPSKLDPHLAMIENWLATEPQLTAIAIVSRLSDRYPEQFGKKRHSIVQRLLKSLRNNAAKKLFTRSGATTTATFSSGSVDGSGCQGPDPSTALSLAQTSKGVTQHGSVHLGVSAAMEIADSGDGDHLFRSIVITGSGDRDHAQGGTVDP